MPQPSHPVSFVRELDELAGQFYADLYRLSFGILGDAAEADDAVQETLLAAASGLEAFRREASLRTWLFAIAINVCRGLLRRRRASRGLHQALAAIQRLVEERHAGTGYARGPEESVLANEQAAELWTAVARLDEKHRLPVILHYVHQLNAAEIASLLAVSEGTVYSRLHYARQRLLVLLEPLHEAYPPCGGVPPSGEGESA
jgi:RNA polymerase sigma-70 factor (ECF subfamily)